MKYSLIVLLICALLLTSACGAPAVPDADAPETTAAETAEAETSALPTEAPSAEETAESETAAPETTAAAVETTTEDTLPVQVFVQWADAMPKELRKAQQYTVIEDESSTLILFTTNRTARDFRVLGLELADVDDDGNISFRTETLLELDALAPNQPVAIETVFWGDIPNNGFSYVDENGQTQYFSVNISGMDGSLVTEPFIPA
jgi:hypothetical protein